ncbi:MAG: hypothetical protein KGZ65_07755 [Sphingomonadales bacterium]|nr:hypothetical protein [Sphingomonadaceae bacterium]MBS3931115.1 hypothetical protein [Sphingomonadales bacterium]
MRVRFISLLLILAALFGGAIAPSVAHAQGDSDVHVTSILDFHEADATTGDDQQKPASGMPGETAAHHHCSVGLAASAPDICLVDASRQAILPPASTRLLVSHVQAPPTQPPSA